LWFCQNSPIFIDGGVKNYSTKNIPYVCIRSVRRLLVWWNTSLDTHVKHGLDYRLFIFIHYISIARIIIILLIKHCILTHTRAHTHTHTHTHIYIYIYIYLDFRIAKQQQFNTCNPRPRVLNSICRDNA